MLLPARNTVKPLIEEQKFQSAKEGISLAKKVDALRQELNLLQKNRDEFIAGTLAEIEKATISKNEHINALQGQIGALEASRKELLKPLTAGYKELELKKKDFEKEIKDFSKKEQKLEDVKVYLIEKEKEIMDEDRKIKLLLKEAKNNAEQ